MEITSRLKNVVALTRNINFPTNEYSISIFQDLYDKYVNEYGFRMFNNNSDYGPFGCFVYENTTKGIILHLIEVYYFENKNTNKTLNEKASQLGRHFCILVEHDFDDNGQIKSSIYQKCPNISWGEIRDDLQEARQALDCCKGAYNYINTIDYQSSYKMAVENEK